PITIHARHPRQRLEQTVCGIMQDQATLGPWEVVTCETCLTIQRLERLGSQQREADKRDAENRRRMAGQFQQDGAVIQRLQEPLDFYRPYWVPSSAKQDQIGSF